MIIENLFYHEFTDYDNRKHRFYMTDCVNNNKVN